MMEVYKEIQLKAQSELNIYFKDRQLKIGVMFKNFNKKVGIINKIIVKQSVLFYTEVQKYRNEVMHDPDKYRLFVIKWYEKVVESIERDNRP